MVSGFSNSVAPLSRRVGDTQMASCSAAAVGSFSGARLPSRCRERVSTCRPPRGMGGYDGMDHSLRVRCRWCAGGAGRRNFQNTQPLSCLTHSATCSWCFKQNYQDERSSYITEHFSRVTSLSQQLRGATLVGHRTAETTGLRELEDLYAPRSGGACWARHAGVPQ